MTRTAALRASAFFALLSLVFVSVGVSSHAQIAEALFLITGSLAGLMLLFGFAAPAHEPVPIRIRRRPR